VATQKRVVKIGEEVYFRSPRKFFGKPKRLFKILGTFKNFPKKKVPVKNPMDGLTCPTKFITIYKGGLLPAT
jgi:hypothetical protein